MEQSEPMPEAVQALWQVLNGFGIAPPTISSEVLEDLATPEAEGGPAAGRLAAFPGSATSPATFDVRVLQELLSCSWRASTSLLEQLEAGARGNDPLAQVTLAETVGKGLYGIRRPNRKRANDILQKLDVRHLEQRARDGCVYSAYQIGVLLCSGIWDSRDESFYTCTASKKKQRPVEVCASMSKAAQALARARAEAEAAREAEACESRWREACHWFARAAEGLHAGAQHALAICLRKGYTIEGQSADRVGFWLQLAALRSYPPAVNDYAVELASQKAAPQGRNMFEARKFFESASNMGLPAAIFNVALANHLGVGGSPADYAVAMQGYLKAAEIGNSAACVNVGLCYFHGQGSQLDPRLAARYFETAAQMGDAKGLCNAGYCYHFGKGCFQDVSKAVEYFRSAALKRSRTAIRNLAYCFAIGSGVRLDTTLAREFAELADSDSEPTMVVLREFASRVQPVAAAPLERGAPIPADLPQALGLDPIYTEFQLSRADPALAHCDRIVLPPLPVDPASGGRGALGEEDAGQEDEELDGEDDASVASSISAHTRFLSKSSGLDSMLADSGASVVSALTPGTTAVQNSHYFGPVARRKFYSHTMDLARTRNYFTEVELEGLRESSTLILPSRIPIKTRPGRPSSKSTTRTSTPPSPARLSPLASSLSRSPSRGGNRSIFRPPPRTLPPLSLQQQQDGEQKGSSGTWETGVDDDLTVQAPLSARSCFIQELLFDPVVTKLPRSIMVIRSRDTTKISLAHQGVGDELAIALAKALPQLPNLHTLNLKDNRLTDESLAPILVAMQTCRQLVSLDLGWNKIDEEAADALAAYLAMGECPLLELGLSKADVDDSECGALMDRLVDNLSVTSLDISHNLIGDGEVINIVMPDFDTGGEKIAEFLEDKTCRLVVLNLAWNAIRKDSARQLGDALAENDMLEQLDLSYNSFGDEGGQAIGNMLHSNQRLRVLNISNNSIPSRAAFAIASGLRYNQTLTELNMSGNPIGEVGAHSLMQIPLECGDWLVLHLDGCNMVMEDPGFTLDRVTGLPKEPTDEQMLYSCNLSVPYRRALAYELLRVAAEDLGFNILSCTLDKDEFEVERKTLNQTFREHDMVSLYHTKHAQLDEIWNKYDVDGSGTIDEHELSTLLHDLHLDSSLEGVRKVLAKFDIDQSGLLEKDEISELLESAKQDLCERLKPRTVMVKRGESKRVQLPNEGTLRIKLRFNPERDTMPRSSSTEEIYKVMKLAYKADNRLLALELALGHLKLQVEQGQEFVQSLCTEISDVVKRLAKVLPHMSGVQQAQLLVSLQLQDNQSEWRRLETEMGPAFRPILGMYTGHYELDLSKEMDRTALLKLGEQATLEARMNQSRAHLRRDLSQKGNWLPYRNEKLNGAPFELTDSFFDPLPEFGKIEFDFASTARPPPKVTAMSDRRFASFFANLDWPAAQNEDKVANELAVAPGPVHMLKTLDLIYFDRELATLRRRADVTKHHFEDLRLLEIERRAKMDGRDPDEEDEDGEEAAKRSSGPRLARQVRGANESDSDSQPVKTNKSSATFRPDTRTREAALSQVQFGGTTLASSPKGRHQGLMPNPRRVKAKEAMANLRDCIFKRWFTCCQARWIIQNFPMAKYCEPPAHWRADLAVYLFSRIVDLNFFDFVTEPLTHFERAHVVHRLGWLNIFNPHRPDRRFALDLAAREDRILVKMLVHLGSVEPGENWLNESLRWTRDIEEIPGWELTKLWFREDGLPVKGCLLVQYYSGEGKGLAGCKPNNTLRTALMTNVLADPDEDQAEKFKQETSETYTEYLERSLSEDCDDVISWNYTHHLV